MSDRSEAIAWAEKVFKSKPPRYTHASRNAAAFILETEAAWNQRAKPVVKALHWQPQPEPPQ